MSEELTFEKAGRHVGEVHFDQFLVSAWAEFVNRASDDLLARARLPGNHDGGIGGSYRLHLAEEMNSDESSRGAI